MTEQHIMRLDVTMNNVVRVEVLQASSDTNEDVETNTQAQITPYTMAKDGNRII